MLDVPRGNHLYSSVSRAEETRYPEDSTANAGLGKGLKGNYAHLTGEKHHEHASDHLSCYSQAYLATGSVPRFVGPSHPVDHSGCCLVK